MGIICITEDRQMAKCEFENSLFQNDAPLKRRKSSDDYSLTEKYKSIISDELFPEIIKLSGGPQFRYTQQPKQETCNKTETSFYSFSGDCHFNQGENDEDFYICAADLARRSETISQFKKHSQNSQNSRKNSNIGEALIETCKWDEFLEIQNENPDIKQNQWENACNTRNLKIYKKLVEGSPSIYVRANAIIENTDILELFNHFYQDKHRIKWDKMMKEIRVVEKINDLKDVFYYKIDAGFAVSNRDWVVKRVVVKNKNELNEINSIKMICYDTKHEKENEYKGIVRASCAIQAYELTKINNDDVKLELISNVDIKGNVPKFLVNKFADGGTKDWIENLIKYNKQQQSIKK